jgi:tetrahydromethanopterin S-methyltransferase subunit A
VNHDPPSPEAEADQPAGWPPVPGDFVLGGPDSPVAVCTLATQSILARLRDRPEVAIAGRVYTENVGIEKMVQNLLAGERLRVLIVCGRESRHRVGQAILSLHRNGVDPITHRIRGATGPEPVVPNLSQEQVEAFRRRFEVVDLIGEQDVERILEQARELSSGPPAAGEASRAAAPGPDVPTTQAEPDPTSAWTYDPRGFFLIHLDRDGRRLLLEHYDQERHLRHRIVGEAATALSQSALRLGLVGELSHAAYLGRELAKAEAALRLGLDYQQDSPLRPRG